MLKQILAAVCGLVLWSAASAWADAARHWRGLTLGDVEAAHRMLREDHPAASRTINDTDFNAALERAYRLARRRAGEVESYEGYLAVMAGFANAMGDSHIWSRPLYRPENIEWPALAVARRGDRFVVAVDERGEDASLVGAALVSCDGVVADAFAEAKLGGFHAVWEIEAQRVQNAPRLLIDDGNPFVLKPNACVFERDGAQIETALTWRTISRRDLSARLGPAVNVGAAGYGLRDFAGGVWIALEGLNEEAQAVVEAVRADADRLHAAPIVVLDVRGNGGGNSRYGRAIADVLFADAAEPDEDADSPPAASCQPVWRASPRNLAQLRAYVERFAHMPDFVAFVRARLADAEAAAAAGREFGGEVDCGGAEEPALRTPPSEPGEGPRVVLLTDAACFSSCLLVTEDFRQRGALHVGAATNANTHFSEVREDRLPSGLSMFSTLQAVMPAAPRQIGPFEPDLRYDGDLRDTAALEAWVADIAGR